VPGLAKQTSTPPATKVRTRLSAPFIIPLPFAPFFKKVPFGDQSSPTPFVKGFADIAAIAKGAMAFLPQRLKIAGLTSPWLAKSRQLWPVSQRN
jgi:hypothetical protein